MVENGTVSAYAVYRNLVHVGQKKLGTLKKNKKKSQKHGTTLDAGALNGSSNKVNKGSIRKVNKQCKESHSNEIALNNCDSEITCLTEVNLSYITDVEELTKGIDTPVNMKNVINSREVVETPLRGGESRLVSRSVRIKKTNPKKMKSKIKSSTCKTKSKLKSCNSSGKCKVKPKSSSNVLVSEKMEESILRNFESGNSFADGQKAFSWLIHPATPEDFFKSAWEKRPLHIRRRISNYYKSLLSTKKIDRMLREHNIQYTKNLDITSYVDGKRETHNPIGRAYPSVVWDYYSNGCSIRLLNPQTFIDKIWYLNAALQDMFGCFVGANVYLTPPDSQGFAPHYDDIEAFILQVEGKKHWKLYTPLSTTECLPRFSSRNFTQEEIGEPILDVVLEPGDMLYFPRGVIHQGSTLPDAHSLHITISSYQRNTWGDLLEKLVPVALKLAIEDDVEFREGLPTDYLRYMGIAHSDFTSEGRNQFIAKVSNLMKRLFKYAPIDAAVDQMGKQLIHDALPPALSLDEKSCTVLDDGEEMCNGVVTNRVEFEPDVRIKLLRGNVIRLVVEEDIVRAYHCVENTREYHFLEEPQYVELSSEMGPAMEFLIHSYPSFVSIAELPLDGLTEKLQLVSDLWEKGLILTETPLDSVSV